MSRLVRAQGFVTGVALLLSVATARAAEKPLADPPAATLGGREIPMSRVEDKGRMPLFQIRVQEYETRLRILNGLIAEELLKAEAEARKTTAEALLKAEVLDKAAPVKPEEIATTYENVKARFKDRAEADVKAQIERELTQQRQNERRQAFAKELRAKAGVRVFLEPPRLTIDATGGDSRGPETATVTIVEFSDFQCPYCVRAFPTVKKVLETYAGKVRFVYHDLPLAMHPFAIKAAEAGGCAADQGKFWEMHDRMFAANGKLEVSDLKLYAGELGLDAERFATCLDQGQKEGRWQAGKALAESYGISGTPAFFINGRYISGARPFETFAEIIDDELARASPASRSVARP
jgi:protein-disulfide isomerase